MTAIMTEDQIARVERLIARMEPSTCPLSLDAMGRPFPPSPVADHEAAERAADSLALRTLLAAYREHRQRADRDYLKPKDQKRGRDD